VETEHPLSLEEAFELARGAGLEKREPLAIKPEPGPRRALQTMAELQLETVQLAPSGPNVDRARVWLAEGIEVLR
jgi:hypothetical protein